MHHRRWWKRLLHTLPSPCLLCHQSTHSDPLCTGCIFDLPYLEQTPYRCDICAVPLDHDAHYCGRCLSRPPAFEHCRAAFVYQSPVDHLIHQFKYHHQLACGRALAQRLGEHLLSARDQADRWPEVIVPVPMHWSRRLRRGYNQTDLLARDLGRILDLPVETRWCRRTRRTPNQQGLNRQARERNLKQAFNLSRTARNGIRGRQLALLDDVVTTTSTARELSHLLLNAGAQSVEIWALARTPDTQPHH